MNIEEFKYDFEELRLPHETLVAYHEWAVENYGPRDLTSTVEEEERDLSILTLIEQAIRELDKFGWAKEDIETFLRNVVESL